MDLFDILLARKLGGGGGGGSLTTYVDDTFTPESTPVNCYEYTFYNTSIPEETTPIYVTFDGVDYTVPYDADYGGYGAQYNESLGGFDWSTYPFSISSDVVDNSIWVGTETNVEHSIIIKGEGGGGGSSITVESLYATENNTYEAPEGTAYSPVVVNVSNRIIFSKFRLNNICGKTITVSYYYADNYNIYYTSRTITSGSNISLTIPSYINTVGRSAGWIEIFFSVASDFVGKTVTISNGNIAQQYITKDSQSNDNGWALKIIGDYVDNDVILTVKGVDG